MKSVIKRYRLLALPLVVLLAGCGAATDDSSTTGEVTATEEPSVIEVRQKNFETILDAFKGVRAQLESDTPDFGLIETNATAINTSAKLISDYFPEGTGIGSGADTEARAMIWEQPEEFAAASQKLIDTSAALAQTAKGGDLAAVQDAVKSLGGSCKSCHDVFRLDDD